MLSDALHAFGEPVPDAWLELAAYGCLTPAHAGQFKAFVRQVHSQYQLTAILKGEVGWPAKPEERDVLYFLSQSLRGQLLKELPAEKNGANRHARDLAHRAKALIRDLSHQPGNGPDGRGENEGRPCPPGSWSKSCATCRAWWRRNMAKQTK